MMPTFFGSEAVTERVCKYLFIEVRKREMYVCFDELLKIN